MIDKYTLFLIILICWYIIIVVVVVVVFWLLLLFLPDRQQSPLSSVPPPVYWDISDYSVSTKPNVQHIRRKFKYKVRMHLLCVHLIYLMSTVQEQEQYSSIPGKVVQHQRLAGLITATHVSCWDKTHVNFQLCLHTLHGCWMKMNMQSCQFIIICGCYHYLVLNMLSSWTPPQPLSFPDLECPPVAHLAVTDNIVMNPGIKEPIVSCFCCNLFFDILIFVAE